ncbi:Acyl transferase/acyl hydrolase/lysophospholipase [Pseudocohnilembus persalinus]|uniref:Acyl transferase/acyl hydrolase/lysophospholipase n=1 Tax=Pseudocohnilembus persalinus TaxID=266149 RepID=A0A0V0QBH6_PSEPJ|nr:Acyl transferase/acyl hydrolase/lysophospholipase [Pseudocohnilembus persalinus]|eukprot:KRW99573.1 Acyl transferase/acyl hydrolase/lysophospholipase [Pseudocohnilembus persalinus]
MKDVLNFLITTITNEVIEDIVILKDIINYEILKRKNKKYIKIQQQYLKQQMKKQKNYDEWKIFAEKYDKVENVQQWKDRVQTKDYNYKYIKYLRNNLREARQKQDIDQLIQLIRANAYRNIGNIHNPRLYHQSYVGTKSLIEDFQREMELSLKFLAQNNGLAFERKYDFFNELRQIYGRTGLVLSGGGLMGMYHLGFIYALRQKNLIPKIVSGSSVGSLCAAFLCCTDYEEIPDIVDASYCIFRGFNQFRIQSTVSRNWQRLVRFLEKGFFLQINEVSQFMRDNMGDITFIEAYEKTGFILNIQVTAMGTHQQPRLLNYITAPDVTIWSAVSCSCSVPILYCPNDLWVKNQRNELVLWTPGIKYQDGSFSADLPLKQLSEMFNINGFIVSQVNPFVVPWDANRLQHMRHVSKAYFYFRRLAEKIKSLIIDEVQHRFSSLDKIGLFPEFLKQLITIVTQNYKGDITIYPEPKLKHYLNILHNPLNQDDLMNYFEHGLKQTFCFIYQIDSYTKFERIINQYYKQLRNEIRQKIYDKHIQSAKTLEIKINSEPNLGKFDHVLIDDNQDFSVLRDRSLSKDYKAQLFDKVI